MLFRTRLYCSSCTAIIERRSTTVMEEDAKGPIHERTSPRSSKKIRGKPVEQDNRILALGRLLRRKKFNLEGPDRNSFYWADSSLDPRYISCRRQGGGGHDMGRFL